MVRSNGALWLLMVLSTLSQTLAQESERQILQHFYRETGGSSWDQNYGWEANSDDICGWFGVICVDEPHEEEGGSRRHLQNSQDNPGIKGLSLKNNNLSGRTPLSLFKLPSLESVYFSFNEDLDISFLGSQYAQSLKDVKMHTTATSTIAGIAGLKSTLEGLHMSGSRMGEIQIPKEIFQLTKLTALHMADCQFQGEMPSGLSKLTRLEQFNVLSNSLTGRIPSSISDLSNLEVLSLSKNKFTGWLPEFLQELPKLEELFLDNNEITGEILPFSKQTSLQLLFLNANELTGGIPSNFMEAVANSDALDAMRVDLAGNQLTGAVPATLDRLEGKSFKIILADNEFTSIDSELCDNGEWMDGFVSDYSCDAILCPVRTYNRDGRQSSDAPCSRCDTALKMGQTTCLDASDERATLTQLYQATGGPSRWYHKDNWLDDDINVCLWYGIECWDLGGNDVKNGKIRKIELDNNGLLGTIPSNIWAIEYLFAVSVSWNPVVLPFDGIGLYNNIRRINVAATNTSDFAGLENAGDFFYHLMADKLRLGGTIPTEVLQVLSLKSLSMAECDLSGVVDESIEQLSNLQELYLYGNSLRGQIPESISALTDLKILALGKNRLTGTIPVALESIVGLEAVSLTDQITKGGGLSGEILPFSVNAQLTNLMVGHNQLEGTIPRALLNGVGTGESLLVDLSNNLLTGEVPGSLSRFRSMNIMLENNYFTEIDDRLCLMDDWMSGGVREFGCDAILCPGATAIDKGRQVYDSSECQGCGGSSESFIGQTQCDAREPPLTERIALQLLFDNAGGFGWKNSENWYSEDTHICEWYGVACDDAKSVVSINLGANELKGHIPTQLYRLPNLVRLSLFGNNVIFSFEGIDNAHHLKSLILDSTGLKSLAGIEKARSLVELNIRYNRMSGTFPSEIQNLVQLESLELSNNAFRGPLPQWIGQLPNLSSFLASDNALSGQIVDFAGSKHLIHLDLSHNKLTGTIPETFLYNAPSTEKVFVDLSLNQIEGILPFDLERLERLTIILENNEIAAIDQNLCEIEGWNDYDVQAYGCDGILCPIGTSSAAGRQISDELPCETCSQATYMGSSQCHSAAWRHLSAATAGLVGLLTAATSLLML